MSQSLHLPVLSGSPLRAGQEALARPTSGTLGIEASNPALHGELQAFGVRWSSKLGLGLSRADLPCQEQGLFQMFDRLHQIALRAINFA